MRDAPPLTTSLARWAYVGAATAALLGPATVLGPLDRSASIALQRRWAEAVVRRLGIEVSVEDRSGPRRAGRGTVYVHLNQQTLLAPVLYAFMLPEHAYIIVNVEFAALPFVGWMSLAQGAIPIVRQRPAQAKAALDAVVERLGRGESFGISIEGRRTADGSLSPFKKGPVVMALQAQADLVPFMTHGEYALWPRGEWRVRPGRVECVAYPRVSTEGLTLDDRHRLTQQLRDLAEAEIAARAVPRSG